MSDPVQARPSIPRRSEIIRSFRERGGKIAAVFPIHQPRALFRAFDILPVEVWGPPGVDTSTGDAHLQAYTCSIVRCGLSFLLRGGLDIADLLVVPHACDSLQGLGSILLDFIRPSRPVLPFYLPRNPSDAGVTLLAEELRFLYERLAGITGQRPDESTLLESIHREEAADASLAALFARRLRIPLSDREFYRLVRSREYLPAEYFQRLAEETLKTEQDTPRDGVPLVLSGILPEPMELLDAIQRAGGVVVADDFCCSGRRHYPAGTSQRPFLRMAESLLGGPPDTTRGNAVQDRIDHLRRLAGNAGARGIVFYEVKFCEPEQFYLPQVRKGLELHGIRSVEVEGDLGVQLSHQAMTRIEAFVETLA